MWRMLVLVLVLALLGCSDTGSLRMGEPLPSLRFPDRQSGELVTLPDALSAVPTLLSFRTLGCRFCENDLAVLAQLQREFGAQLQILAINVGFELEDVDRFLADQPVNYSILVDESGESMRRLGLVGLPMTVLMDAEGRVAHKLFGELQLDRLRALLRQMLAGEAAA